MPRGRRGRRRVSRRCRRGRRSSAWRTTRTGGSARSSRTTRAETESCWKASRVSPRGTSNPLTSGCHGGRSVVPRKSSKEGCSSERFLTHVGVNRGCSWRASKGSSFLTHVGVSCEFSRVVEVVAGGAAERGPAAGGPRRSRLRHAGGGGGPGRPPRGTDGPRRVARVTPGHPVLDGGSGLPDRTGRGPRAELHAGSC